MRVKAIISSQDISLPGGLEFKKDQPFVLTDGQKLTWSVARDWKNMAQMLADGQIVEELDKHDEKQHEKRHKKEG